MQTRGTFPALNSGQSFGGKKKATPVKPVKPLPRKAQASGNPFGKLQGIMGKALNGQGI